MISTYEKVKLLAFVKMGYESQILSEAVISASSLPDKESTCLMLLVYFLLKQKITIDKMPKDYLGSESDFKETIVRKEKIQRSLLKLILCKNKFLSKSFCLTEFRSEVSNNLVKYPGYVYSSYDTELIRIINMVLEEVQNFSTSPEVMKMCIQYAKREVESFHIFLMYNYIFVEEPYELLKDLIRAKLDRFSTYFDGLSSRNEQEIFDFMVETVEYYNIDINDSESRLLATAEPLKVTKRDEEVDANDLSVAKPSSSEAVDISNQEQDIQTKNILKTANQEDTVTSKLSLSNVCFQIATILIKKPFQIFARTTNITHNKRQNLLNSGRKPLTSADNNIKCGGEFQLQISEEKKNLEDYSQVPNKPLIANSNHINTGELLEMDENKSYMTMKPTHENISNDRRFGFRQIPVKTDKSLSPTESIQEIRYTQQSCEEKAKNFDLKDKGCESTARLSSLILSDEKFPNHNTKSALNKREISESIQPEKNSQETNQIFITESLQTIPVGISYRSKPNNNENIQDIKQQEAETDTKSRRESVETRNINNKMQCLYENKCIDSENNVQLQKEEQENEFSGDNSHSQLRNWFIESNTGLEQNELKFQNSENFSENQPEFSKINTLEGKKPHDMDSCNLEDCSIEKKDDLNLIYFNDSDYLSMYTNPPSNVRDLYDHDFSTDSPYSCKSNYPNQTQTSKDIIRGEKNINKPSEIKSSVTKGGSVLKYELNAVNVYNMSFICVVVLCVI